MASATIGIVAEGRRVDISADIPDELAHAIITQVTDQIIHPPAEPAPDKEPVKEPAP